MAKFANVETDTLQGAFTAWLRVVTLENKDAGITALSEAEIWVAIREERNRLLQECDWALIEDSPKSDDIKEQWKIYRKILRDLPQSGAPSGVTWPEKPTE